jgi:uncharacterized protein YegP (UPF0339 family)
MKFIIYKDRKKQFRWRLVAKNGNIIADSGEGYTRKRSVHKAIVLLRKRSIHKAIVLLSDAAFAPVIDKTLKK